MARKKKAERATSSPEEKKASRHPNQTPKGPEGAVPADADPSPPEGKEGRRRGLRVAGIGASAGGLEALTEFLQEMPADSGIALVVVSHLDPEHKSALGEILSRVSSMPVREVEDGLAVEPDHVYVMPPNRDMIIEQGILHLAPRAETRGLQTPIDTFLHSLAQDCGSQAVGVILSGTGSDGTGA